MLLRSFLSPTTVTRRSRSPIRRAVRVAASMPSIIHSGGLDAPAGLKIAGGLIYTANAANDSLSIFNQQSWAPVAVVTRGSLATPEGIAVAGGTIFVANAGSSDIATYECKTRKPSGRITGNGLAEPLGDGSRGWRPLRRRPRYEPDQSAFPSQPKKRWARSQRPRSTARSTFSTIRALVSVTPSLRYAGANEAAYC